MKRKISLLAFIFLLCYQSADAQIWKRVADSVKHRKQYGLYAGASAFTNINVEVGAYYNRYKFLYTRKRAWGLEAMVFPYQAIAPKFSYHAQILAYAHIGGQMGVFTDFKSLAPFLRTEIGYSYKKYVDIRIGKNIQLFKVGELSKHINSWQISAIWYLRVFSKKK